VNQRRAGLLVHVTSLPGRFGIGDLGPEAERFLDWAASAGQGLWQVLPLHPTGQFDSPYGGVSAFAGNPLMISPERLVEERLLPEDALERVPLFSAERVDGAAVRRWKEELLRASWSHVRANAGDAVRAELEAFRAQPRQAAWLSDWALFAALKSRHPEASWSAWPVALARREPSALAAARRELESEIAYQEYLQMLFFRQWDRVHASAKQRGIVVFGDVPIYISLDSADVWAHPELFALDEAGQPELVAGVPPDYFSETGQLWGYPLYRWDQMEREGFAWWIERFRMSLAVADLVRIDHFRAFASYWAVPAKAADARGGAWLPGPGVNLFRALKSALADVAIVAEDLGTITEDVKELLAALGIPGMKVLQFAFSEADSPHAPHRHVENAVVYTGTHDNDTARGWYAGLASEDRARVRDYLGTDRSRIEWDLIRAAYASVADRAVVPLQDVFGLGRQARMNTPARAEGNWAWRARKEDFTEQRAKRLKRLAELTGRSR
jgi:4-alpha-glucanotransferase